MLPLWHLSSFHGNNVGSCSACHFHMDKLATHVSWCFEKKTCLRETDVSPTVASVTNCQPCMPHVSRSMVPESYSITTSQGCNHEHVLQLLQSSTIVARLHFPLPCLRVTRNAWDTAITFISRSTLLILTVWAGEYLSNMSV